MQNLIGDIPWWLGPVVALAAAVMVISGFRSGSAGMWKAGLVLLLAGCVLGLLSYFVESDTQKVEKRTRQFVAAVVSQDWDKMSKLMEPTTILAFEGGHELEPGGRDSIVKLVQAGVAAYGLQSAGITTIQANQAQTIITVSIDVTSTGSNAPDRGEDSSWAFEWQKSEDGWELNKITCVRLNQASGANAAILMMQALRANGMDVR